MAVPTHVAWEYLSAAPQIGSRSQLAMPWWEMNAMLAPWKSASADRPFERKKTWRASCTARLLNLRAIGRSFARPPRLLCTLARSFESRGRCWDYDVISALPVAFDRRPRLEADPVCVPSTRGLSCPARQPLSRIDLWPVISNGIAS